MVSANVFACGSNQNCGNVITDRPTTRIHHAPGGASSISFSDGFPLGAVSDNQRSRKGAQDSELRQSVETVASLLHQPKTSKPELAPEAEELADKLDVDDDCLLGVSKAELLGYQKGLTTTDVHAVASSVAQEEVNTAVPEAEVATVVEKVTLTTAPKSMPVTAAPEAKTTVVNDVWDGRSSNSFANGANQNCGNVLTDRPTTRIRQAPGGNSSLVLG
mmetsp:Transcript_65747/g.122593  ORF Transcript_65747/g.122593 Transcript_65747/m.122593 type:complete len:218 (+) Transcript_65747:73-726(+)